MPITRTYGPSAVDYGTAIAGAAQSNQGAEDLKYLMSLYAQLEELQRQQTFQSGESQKTRTFESEQAQKERTFKFEQTAKDRALQQYQLQLSAWQMGQQHPYSSYVPMSSEAHQLEAAKRGPPQFAGYGM